jgi:hypothetical protein
MVTPHLDQLITAARDGNEEAQVALRDIFHSAIDKVDLETVIEVLLKVAEGRDD